MFDNLNINHNILRTKDYLTVTNQYMFKLTGLDTTFMCTAIEICIAYQIDYLIFIQFFRWTISFVN